MHVQYEKHKCLSMVIKELLLLFANHYLIAHGQGFLVIPEEHVSEFKKKLVAFYEGEDINVISNFLKEKCWKTF